MKTDAPTHGKKRAPFALSARVCWRARSGESREETSELLNVTPQGATLVLAEPPEPGRLLRLDLPGPRGRAKATRMWGLVWGLTQSGGAAGGEGARHSVSVMFVDDEVPDASRFEDLSLYAYLIEEDGRLRLRRQQPVVGGQSNKRKESRLSVPVEVTLEALRADGTVLMSEQTVTENISFGGAAVWTSLLVGPKQVVRVTSERDGVTLTAVVRARRVGQDNIVRLHLEFTDGRWPLDNLM